MANKIKILLTTPLISEFPTKSPTYPLGITYIAGVLEQKGYTVRILDNYLQKNNKDDFVKVVKDFQPSIIGITCNVDDRFEAFKLSDIIKEVCKGIVVALGGPFPSVCHKQIIEDIRNVDIVVRGEGEYTLLDVVKCVDKNKQFHDIEGITYRIKGEVKVNKPRPFIKKLDELPLPAFHLLKIEEYPNYMREVEGILLNKTSINATHTASLIFGRGCPYNCLFCSSKELWRRSYRILSPENAVWQIEYFTRRGVTSFAFWDDHLLLDKRWFNDFVELINRKKLQFIFKCLGRVDSIDEKVAKKLKEIGCRAIFLGIENGSQAVLNLMNKGINVNRIENTVKILHKNRIAAMGEPILNTPGETFENILENLGLFKKLVQNYQKYPGLPLNIVIYPGTDLEKIAIEKGHLKNFKWTKKYYEKRNLLLGQKPCTPLYENVPIEQLVERVILGALKVGYYKLLKRIILNRIVKNNVSSESADKNYTRNFYVLRICRIILKAPLRDKINYIYIFLFKLICPAVKNRFMGAVRKKN